MSDRRVSRRTFLTAAATGGSTLVLGFSIASLRGLRSGGPVASRATQPFKPDLWISINNAGDVDLRIHKCEMGQGVLTALPILIAEELEVEWSRVRVTQADADFRFTDQNTSGSTSVPDSWIPLRQAGAVARTMLVRAAAGHWGVPEAECEARAGVVSHPRSGRRAHYGQLAGLAARIPPPSPDTIALKPPERFRLIGAPTGSLNAREKITGRQVYGMDLQIPGMLYAAVTRCSVAGGILRRLDERRTRTLPGVRDVIRLAADQPSRLPERVAVIAGSTWAALQGRAALEIEWDEGPHASLSSHSIRRQLHQLANAEPIVLRNDGDAIAAGVDGPRAIEATYEVPYLAHAPMEPVNCTAVDRGDSIEIWAPTQFPQRAVEHVSRVTGLPGDAIRLHVIPMGGGFGRRVYPDFVVEAVQVARATRAPAKTVWSREDDLRNDFYRPVGLLHLSAVLEDDGYPNAWVHRLTGPSILRQIVGGKRSPAESELYPQIVPYRIPNLRVEYREVEIPIPLGVWRSVAQSQNLFAVESFIDELAHRAGADPITYRSRLLNGFPRAQRVLDAAARAAGWGTPAPAGTARGVAIACGDPTSVALVAEASVGADGGIQVRRLTCAVDCGQVVNPLTLKAQIEGGLVFGLTAALWGEISVKDGRIEQSNFHDYRMARLADMPAIDVRVVGGNGPPGGVGEASVPVVAPALANAVFAATGVRRRRLPLVARTTTDSR
jgi:isoquinoline 1-oxidoreductase subunit beta